ncbi:CASP-like protein 4A4 [Helianthus annuus]|uniref:CASP-like protein 4A4 n=1 Tax=Helianthus annuus TaxID=4232 RepID=UPI0016533AAD|nr:CASP-like protein 4A4 [Helianthus annuus]
MTAFINAPLAFYNVIITTDVFIYSLYQLFKGIFDIANKGILISDKRSINSKNYILLYLPVLSSRILKLKHILKNQLAGYLLVSCSAVTTVMINQVLLSGNTSLKRAATASICMSVAAFLTTAVCAILSGYKLSKRVMW